MKSEIVEEYMPKKKDNVEKKVFYRKIIPADAILFVSIIWTIAIMYNFPISLELSKISYISFYIFTFTSSYRSLKDIRDAITAK